MLVKPPFEGASAIVRLTCYARSRTLVWQLSATVAVCATGFAEGASAAGEQVVLRQTLLGPMPDNQMEVSLSADASRVAVLSSSGTRQVVYIDGNAGQPYSSVQQASPPGGNDSPQRSRAAMLMISPDKTRCAYVATKGPNDAMMVVNHKEGPVFERIATAAFGPQGHRLVYIGTKGGKSYIVIDGTISPPYQQVLATEMLFSADGQHVGYAAQTAGAGGTPTWHAVIDGKEQPAFIQVEGLRLSKTGGHFAYIARTANAQEFCVVYDGNAGPKFQLIQSLVLSDDGTHCAYAGCKLSDPKAPGRVQWVAMIDGQEGPAYQQIDTVVLSPDGKHRAYAASDKPGSGRPANYAVVDGKKSLDYTFCGSFTWSPDSKHIAYVAMNNGKNVVVYDGQEQTAFDQVDHSSLQFTADSKRFGYVATDSTGAHAVIDGKVGQPRQAIEPRSLAFTPDGQHYCFRARTYADWFVIGDDAASPAPEQPVISELVVSADGKHAASVSVTNPQAQNPTMRLLLDGKPVGPECGRIEHVKISDDGAHWAYIGAVPDDSGKGAIRVVHDGRIGPGFMRIDTFTLSPDGQHVAFAGYAPDGRKTLVVDEFAGPTFDEILTITGDCPQAIQFRADGSLDCLVVADKKLSRIVMPAEAIAGLAKPVDSHGPSASGYAKLYEFGAAKNDGAKPSVIAAGPDGTIYGATTAGGEFQKGVIFSVKPDGSNYKILRPIEGGQGDGAYPNSMFVGSDGAIYGSMQVEGAGSHGVVYRAAADGSAYSILHAFTGNKDGDNPVIYCADKDGIIYGISGRNRTSLYLFRMKSDGSEFSVIYTAPDPNSGKPDEGIGPFVDGGDGYFYGVAGLNIFKVKKDGTGYAVVRKFAGPPRDIQMADRAPILGADGLLYGFASNGGKTTGGVIYKIARDGSGYSMFFDPGDEVLGPRALAEGPDGKLYLLAEKGFVRVNKDGSEFTVLHELAGGFFPLSAVVHDGVFYSATSQGNKGGFVFRYGIGGAGNVAAAATPPTITYQTVPPTPIEGNVEIPAAPQ